MSTFISLGIVAAVLVLVLLPVLASAYFAEPEAEEEVPDLRY